MKERITWDELGIEITRTYAKRSGCKHFKVGAAFFKGNKLLVCGYNGPPKGEPHCIDIGCLKEENGVLLPAGSGKCRGAHAEINGIVNAALEGVNIGHAKVYCTYSPCYNCAKHLVNLSITEFIYEKDYPEEDQRVFELFKRRGIIIRKFR